MIPALKITATGLLTGDACASREALTRVSVAANSAGMIAKSFATSFGNENVAMTARHQQSSCRFDDRDRLSVAVPNHLLPASLAAASVVHGDSDIGLRQSRRVVRAVALIATSLPSACSLRRKGAASPPALLPALSRPRRRGAQWWRRFFEGAGGVFLSPVSMIVRHPIWRVRQCVFRDQGLSVSLADTIAHALNLGDHEGVAPRRGSRDMRRSLRRRHSEGTQMRYHRIRFPFANRRPPVQSTATRRACAVNSMNCEPRGAVSRLLNALPSPKVTMLCPFLVPIRLGCERGVHTRSALLHRPTADSGAAAAERDRSGRCRAHVSMSPAVSTAFRFLAIMLARRARSFPIDADRGKQGADRRRGRQSTKAQRGPSRSPGSQRVVRPR